MPYAAIWVLQSVNPKRSVACLRTTADTMMALRQDAHRTRWRMPVATVMPVSCVRFGD